MNSTECLSYIRSLLPSLKGVERKLGEFIVENPEDFVNMAAAKPARNLD